MSPLEDEIRETLRSAAGRLREVRPLHLPSADTPDESPRSTPRAWWARWLHTWQVPAAAAAAVVLVAVVLVTGRSLGNEAARAPSSSPDAGSSSVVGSSAVAGPASAATPRYYVELGWARSGTSGGSWAIIAGDRQTGKTLGTFPLPKGGTLFSGQVSGAADNRTFIVSAAPSGGTIVAPTWYLVRIVPGAGDPLQVTKLPIQSPAAEEVRDIAVSGNGTELAVVASMPSASAGGGLALQVYATATGQLQHSWSTGFKSTPGNEFPVSDLSWVGVKIVGFAVTYSPEVREEVRTLDIGKPGTNLMADSRLVWSQYVPAAPHGTRHAAHTCDRPFLTGNGQAVVCGNGVYSASDHRMTAVWLAYPLATPTRPRVIGSLKEPPAVSNFNGPVAVDWVNYSGTQVIGTWNTSIGVGSVTEVSNYEGVIANGKVTQFARVFGAEVAW